MTYEYSSIMASEAADVPCVVETQLRENNSLCHALGEKIRTFAPSLVYLVGRGSSDHAGVFAKYLVEIEAGIPVAAAAPSVFSVYQRSLKLERALVIVISQSGRSPDIINQVEMAKKSGAMCVGLINDETSPLAAKVDFLVPLRASEEKAVAATKSYVASLTALIQIVAHWQSNTELLSALEKLPRELAKVIGEPAQLSKDFINSNCRFVVLGRGFGYAIAREVALKLKEVCGVHAEAFSSAEFLHGPIALAQDNLRVIDVTIPDESLLSHKQQMLGVDVKGVPIQVLDQSHIHCAPRLSPLLNILRFYLDVADISVAMGRNPDSPVGLNKITQTL